VYSGKHVPLSHNAANFSRVGRSRKNKDIPLSSFKYVQHDDPHHAPPDYRKFDDQNYLSYIRYSSGDSFTPSSEYLDGLFLQYPFVRAFLLADESDDGYLSLRTRVRALLKSKSDPALTSFLTPHLKKFVAPSRSYAPVKRPKAIKKPDSLSPIPVLEPFSYVDLFVPQGAPETVPLVSPVSEEISTVAFDYAAMAANPVFTLKDVVDKVVSDLVPVRGDNPSNCCDFCGFVVACPHLLKDISFDESLTYDNLSRLHSLFLQESPVLLAIQAVLGDSTDFSSSFLDDSTVPHSYLRRWAACRSLCIYAHSSPVRDVLLALERHFASLCVSSFPIRAIANGLLTDAMTYITGALGAISEYILYIPTFSAEVLTNLRKSLMLGGANFLLSSVSFNDLITSTFNSVFESVVGRDKADTISLAFQQFVKSGVIVCGLKVAVRLFLGYTPLQSTLEVLWDTAFIDLLGSGFNLALHTFTQDLTIQPQGNDESSVFLILSALAMTAIASFTGGMRDSPVVGLSKHLQMAASMVCSGDKLGFGKLFCKVESWLMETDPLEREIAGWRLNFPQTVHLVETYSQIAAIESPPPSLIRSLRFYYSGHLKESARFGEDRARINSYCNSAVSYLLSHNHSCLTSTRMEPSMFMFAGDPGLGKSMLAKNLLNNVARYYIHRSSSSKDVGDFIYPVNPTDKYASGYSGQDMWLFDDWLQVNDDGKSDPSSDVTYLFTLVTALPMALNMASVSDKGMVPACNLLAAGTNVKFVQDGRFHSSVLKSYVHCIADVGALRRRIHYVVVPSIKSPYLFSRDSGRILTPEGRPIVADDHVDPQVLYDFTLYGIDDRPVLSPSKQLVWTWAEINRFAYSLYLRCIEFDPDNVDSSAWKEIFQAQGLHDFIFDQDFIVDGDPPISLGESSFSGSSSTVSSSVRAAWLCTSVPVECIRNCKCGRKGPIPYNDLLPDCLAKAELTYQPVDYFFARNIHCQKNFDALNKQHLPRFLSPGHYGMADWITFTAISRSEVDALPEAWKTHELYLDAHMSEIMFRTWSNNKTKVVVLPDGYTRSVSGCELIVPAGIYIVSGVAWTGSYEHKNTSLTPIVAGCVVSLLTLGVIAYASRSLAAPLIDAVSSIPGKITALFKNEDVEFDKDRNLYRVVPQGNRVVTMNGKRYVVVQYRSGGYRLYLESEWKAQAGDNPLIECIRNKRFVDQCPSIASNLWAVCTYQGNLLGNFTALGESFGVVPLHVARSMQRNSFLLRQDDLLIPICENSDSDCSFTVFPIDCDLAMVTFFTNSIPNFRLPAAKSISSKFVCNSSTGFPDSCKAIVMSRNSDGLLAEVPCDVTSADKEVGYDHFGVNYLIPLSSAKFSTNIGFSGMCGAPYLYLGETNTELILGFHVAYMPSRSLSAMHLMTSKALLLVKPSRPGTSFPSENGPVVPGFGNLLNLPSSKSSCNPVYPSKGKRGVTNFADETSCGYALAPLDFCDTPSGVAHPMMLQMEKISLSRMTAPKSFRSLEAARKHLQLVYSRAMAPSPLLDFQSVVDGDQRLPSLDLSAASGPPLNTIIPTKAVLFKPGTRTLSDDGLGLLNWMENILCPSDWLTRPWEDFESLDCLCSGQMKDEPRPLAKVEIGATRLYTVCPVQEFVLQRKYFFDFADMLSARNLMVFSALGLSPEDYGHMHDGSFKRKIMVGDFKHFDQSFVSFIMREIFKVITTWYGNDGLTRVVDPNLPPLNRDNFMRWRLFERLMRFKCLVGEEVVQFLLMHPSGSFLTTVINIIAQSLLWTDIFLYSVGEGFEDRSTQLFLGDDSFVTCEEECAPAPSFITARMLDVGFEITSDKKDSPLSWVGSWDPLPGTVSEYKFLSRHFARSLDSKLDFPEDVVGVLTPDRLLKMLHFSDKKKMPENFPQQVLSFVQEVSLWNRVLPDGEVVLKAASILEPLSPGFLYKALSWPPSTIKLAVLKAFTDHPELAVCQGEDDDTTFAKDKEVVEEQPFDHSGLSGDHMDPNPANFQRVFERPYRVAQFNWVKTTINGVNLYNSNFPSSYFNGNFNAQAKLANFAALRGTLCVRVTISSSPFAQGMLLLSARPLGRTAATEYEATGDPCIVLDSSSGTSGVIKIPTVLPQGWSFVEFYSANNTVFDWCQITITVLSALVDNGAAGAQVNVFSWLEDVELRNPTVTLFATSPQGKKEKKEKGDFAILDSDASRFLRKVGTGVRTFGGVVVETSAVLGIIAKLAIASGLSTPAHSSSISFVHDVANPGSHFMIGDTPSISLSTVATQRVVLPPDAFGISADEMSIAHFVSRKGLMRRITWAATSLSGSVIADWYVTPCNGHAVSTSFYHSPLSFAASNFQLWRGALRYEFLISKTKFQSGQLEILWQLGTAEAAISSDNETASCYRVIWDIQENCALRVDVPYCSMLPFCQIIVADDLTPIVPPNYTLNHTNGAIIVRVLNPLVAADGTVSSTVDVLVFVSGGPDIEFAVPLRQKAFAAGFSAIPMPKLEGKSAEFEFEPQGGEIFGSSSEDAKDPPVRFSNSTPISNAGAIACVGESLPSLRLLLRRMVPVGRSPNLAINTYYVDHPYMYTNHPTVNYLSHAFAFFTGGVRYRFQAIPDPSSTIINATISTTYGYVGLVPISTYTEPPTYSFIDTAPLDGTVDIPYQNVVPFLPVGALSPVTATYAPPVKGYVFIQQTVAKGIYINDFVGTADDFSFGWQTGLPACSYVAFPYPTFYWMGYG